MMMCWTMNDDKDKLSGAMDGTVAGSADVSVSTKTPSKVGGNAPLSTATPSPTNDANDDMEDDDDFCLIVGQTPSLPAASATTASTTAAKQGGAVIILDQATPSSKKPKNRLLYTCFKETKFLSGKVQVECLKCPKDAPKPPYLREWNKVNGTTMMNHLTRDCPGVDLNLRLELLQCKSTIVIHASSVMLWNPYKTNII